MKPELTKEVVFGTRQPSFVRSRRLGRKVFDLVPNKIHKNLDELSPEVRQIPTNNGDQAIELAHGLRRCVEPESLAGGVYIESKEDSYTVRAKAKSSDTADSEITDAELDVLSLGGSHTRLKVHVNEPKEEVNHSKLIPTDASVMVHGTDGESLFGDGDFHPEERLQIRETIETVVGEFVTSRAVRVFREFPADTSKLM